MPESVGPERSLRRWRKDVADQEEKRCPLNNSAVPFCTSAFREPVIKHFGNF